MEHYIAVKRNEPRVCVQVNSRRTMIENTLKTMLWRQRCVYERGLRVEKNTHQLVTRFPLGREVGLVMGRQ